jgi:Divergent InlB B-repeat domain
LRLTAASPPSPRTPAPFSFVYLQAAGCTHDLGAGGGTAGYAAHELLHNLGAVPDGAPHFCYEHSVCDWYWDVEMQFPTGDPIAKLVLDYGRDDYYGHSGSWFDVQDSPWLSHVGAPRYELAVSFAGKGQGSVASTLPGIACPPTCSIAWEQGAKVVLLATAASGSRLLGWSGACTGVAGCSLTVDAPKQVTATFARGVVSLAVSIRGRGTVTSTPRGITCPPRCSAPFPSGTTVRLRPKPRAGWRLMRCACRIYVDDDRHATVIFRRRGRD